jgi:hypothetical protein
MVNMRTPILGLHMAPQDPILDHTFDWRWQFPHLQDLFFKSSQDHGDQKDVVELEGEAQGVGRP